jgi:hypothetical protein
MDIKAFIKIAIHNLDPDAFVGEVIEAFEEDGLTHARYPTARRSQAVVDRVVQEVLYAQLEEPPDRLPLVEDDIQLDDIGVTRFQMGKQDDEFVIRKQEHSLAHVRKDGTLATDWQTYDTFVVHEDKLDDLRLVVNTPEFGDQLWLSEEQIEDLESNDGPVRPF